MTEAETELMLWVDRWGVDVFESCGGVMVVIGDRMEEMYDIENRWKKHKEEAID